MNFKKTLTFILVLSISFLISVTSSYAEENEENEENEEKTEVKSPDEIIKRENIPNIEDVPDPPNSESLIGDEDDVYEVEIETPSSVTGEKTDGAGTVIDFTTSGAKAFYTIVDNDNNTYHLIIDMDKPENNVYFLSDINKEQLSESTNAPAKNNNEMLDDNSLENDSDIQEVDKSQDKNKEESSGSSGFLLIVISVGLVGAFGYYFLVIRKKNKTTDDNTYEDDEIEIDDEMLESYEDEAMYSEQELLDEKISEEQQDNEHEENNN